MLNNIKFYLNDIMVKYYSHKVKVAIFNAEVAYEEGDMVMHEYWVDKAERYVNKEVRALSNNLRVLS